MAHSKNTRLRLLRYIREGNYPEDAARLVGVTQKTHKEWLEKDQQWKEEVETAEAMNKNRALKAIQSVGKKTWQAMAWWLDRRYFAQYGAKQSTDIKAGGVNIAVIQGGYKPGNVIESGHDMQAMSEAISEPTSELLHGRTQDGLQEEQPEHRPEQTTRTNVRLDPNKSTRT